MRSIKLTSPLEREVSAEGAGAQIAFLHPHPESSFARGERTLLRERAVT